ncbi:hypothetical protein NPIL_553731 [Nephila pilipes]|uniref:Uncharacterized protein n=1 Tax=Nephila pilipes TaxID=299642 RepID=A0A8X6IMR2_NEPPI|nr:hypothetical protein NPIL_553731 [Nephila pilipes]
MSDNRWGGRRVRVSEEFISGIRNHRILLDVQSLCESPVALRSSVRHYIIGDQCVKCILRCRARISPHLQCHLQRIENVCDWRCYVIQESSSCTSRLEYGKCRGRCYHSENVSVCTSTKAVCPKLRRDSLGLGKSHHLRFEG